MRCKKCGDKFEPKKFLQKYCMESDECIKAFYSSFKETEKKSKKKEWNKEKKAIKDKLKTRSEHLKDTQDVFNLWVRLRDKGLNCISCQKPCSKENAGHYVASGKSKFLTFNEDNVHLQCEYCNSFLHSNAIEYRINLIKKIGLEKVEWLEDNRNVTKRYTIPELIELKVIYKSKTKQLKA